MRLTAGEINILIRARDEASRAMGRIGNAAGSMGKAIKRGAQIAGLALAALAVAAAATFINFDSAMTKSIAIMGDLDDAMRETMEVTAREVAKTTTFSMTEAADSYFFLASAGLNAEQAIAALPQVAAFAQAGMFDMALATDLLTDAQSALGLTVDDTAKNLENMARVSDVLVKANTLANATVEQFSTALTREAGAALKSFNIDVEEGVAVLAAFADQGVKGELAGTGLSRILRLMTSAAVNNADAYEQLGVAVFDSTGNINNLADIVADMENALGGMSDETRVAALEALGFQARVQGVILPLLGTSDAIREYDSALRDAAGTTGAIAEKQLESLGAQLSLLRSGFEDVLFVVGKEMEPGLRALVATLREDVIPAIERELPGALDKARQVFDEAVPVIKQFGDDIETAFTFIIDNEGAIVAAIVVIGGTVVLAFGPVSAAVLALAGITAAVALFRTDIEDLSPAMLELERQILEQTITWGKWILVAGIAAGIALALAGQFVLAAAAIGAGAGAAVAIKAATDRLNELAPVMGRVGRLAGAADDTFTGLKQALADTEGPMIRVNDGIHNTAAFLPRATVELKLIALALDEVANQGPNAADAIEIVTAAAIASGQSFRTMTIEMLQTTAAMQAMAEQWTSTQASFVGFGTSPDIQAAIDRLAEFNAPPPPPPPPAASTFDGLGDGADAAIEEVESAFARGARLWMEAVVKGVADGTVTFQDAVDNLAIIGSDGFQTIIDELAAKQTDIERVWQIIIDTIERGFVRIQDIAELQDLGTFGAEVADDFINSMLGADWAAISIAIFEAAEEEAREAAEEAAAAFAEEFEAGLAGLGSLIADSFGTFTGVGGDTEESVAAALAIAERRLELIGLEIAAQRMQEARLAAILVLEGEIADERERSQRIIDGITRRIEGEQEALADFLAEAAADMVAAEDSLASAVDDLADAEDNLRQVREASADGLREMERELQDLRNQLDTSQAIEAGGPRTLTDIAQDLEQARQASNAARAAGFQAELDAAQAAAEARVAVLEGQISEEEAAIEAAEDAVDAARDLVEARRDDIEAIKEEIAARKEATAALIDALEADIEYIEEIRDARIEAFEAEIEAIENTTSAYEDHIAVLEDEIAAIQAVSEADQLRREIALLQAKQELDLLRDEFLPTEEEMLENIAEQVELWEGLLDVFANIEAGIFDVTDAAILMQAGLFELAALILQINAGLLPYPGAGGSSGLLVPGAQAPVFTAGGVSAPIAGAQVVNVTNNIRNITVTSDLDETLRGLR